MIDSSKSYRRDIFAGRSVRSSSGTFLGKVSILLVVFAMMFSSFALFVDISGDKGLQALEPEIRSTVMATGNPPVFVIPPPADVMTNKNDTYTFYIYVRDIDNDTINVTWDFGDGSPLEVNTTLPAASLQTVIISHVYNPYVDPWFEGMIEYQVNFTMNVTLDDGNGNTANRSSAVTVNMPINGAPAVPQVKGPTTTVDPTDVVTISSNASDPDGDPLYWTFLFNNSVSDYLIITAQTPRAAPDEIVWSNVTKTFEAEGDGFYNVTVFVTDALPPNQIFPHNSSDGIGPIHVVTNRRPIVGVNITADPPSPIINGTLRFVEVVYSIDAFDQDSDFLNATWDFGDGTPTVTNMSDGTANLNSFYQVRNYTDAGVFVISVLITDGRPGHDILVSLNMTVMSTNRPPDAAIFYTYATGNFALPDETLNITVVFTDLEMDPLEVIVDWGDNSTWEFYNLTAYENGNTTLILNHTYSSVGKYNLTIYYTDHKIGLFNHSKNLTNIVTVKVPIPPVHHLWSWWDYTSLLLFCMIPAIFVLRFFQIDHKRRRLELEGLTLEEWKLMKSETGKDITRKEGP